MGGRELTLKSWHGDLGVMRDPKFIICKKLEYLQKTELKMTKIYQVGWWGVNSLGDRTLWGQPKVGNPVTNLPKMGKAICQECPLWETCSKCISQVYFSSAFLKCISQGHFSSAFFKCISQVHFSKHFSSMYASIKINITKGPSISSLLRFFYKNCLLQYVVTVCRIWKKTFLFFLEIINL